MKLLKASRNDHPQWYAEYDIDWLTMTFDGFENEKIERLSDNVSRHGLVHPIVIRSPYAEYQTEPNPDVSKFTSEERKKVFNIFVGNQRVVVAKKLGYTHISAYHVKTDQDARKLTSQTQMREFI